MLNPTEGRFNCIKAHIKQNLNAHTHEIVDRRAAAAVVMTLVQHRRRILRECVNNAFDHGNVVTLQKVHNLFGHTMAACVNLDDIVMQIN